MVDLRAGRVGSWRLLARNLALFKLVPEAGHGFPDYEAGQYVALRREDCRLTRRVMGPDGKPEFVPVLDESGRPKRGPVTHSYSVSSAPYETRETGCLEFYVVLEEDTGGYTGRLTESLFRVNPPEDDRLTYVERIVGDFTLGKRAKDFKHVLFVGTGTGLAPFASMVKQLHYEASNGGSNGVGYTLIHTNRTHGELAYHEQFVAIEAAGKLDFVYVPSVSRPTPRDLADPRLGKGRANNVLRLLFELPLKEEEAVEHATAAGKGVAEARAALEKAMRPALPGNLSQTELRKRMDPAATVILTCGNPALMADIEAIAGARNIRFEKEEW